MIEPPMNLHLFRSSWDSLKPGSQNEGVPGRAGQEVPRRRLVVPAEMLRPRWLPM